MKFITQDFAKILSIVIVDSTIEKIKVTIENSTTWSLKTDTWSFKTL